MERTRAQLQEEDAKLSAAPATMRTLGVAHATQQAYVEDAPEDAEEVPDRVRSGNPSPGTQASREDGADVVDLTSDGSQETIRAPRLRAAASVARGVSVTPSAAPASEYFLPVLEESLRLTSA